MKRIYVFDCSVNYKLHGFTEDETGGNLPTAACSGSWFFIKQIELNPGEARIGLDVDELLSALERDGYYINEHNITFTER